jgi:hypothetical protein
MGHPQIQRLAHPAVVSVLSVSPWRTSFARNYKVDAIAARRLAAGRVISALQLKGPLPRNNPVWAEFYKTIHCSIEAPRIQSRKIWIPACTDKAA